MAQTRKYTVVATEPTPNPAALKFNVNGMIIASGSKAYNDEFEAEGDPFAVHAGLNGSRSVLRLTNSDDNLNLSQLRPAAGWPSASV